MGRIPRVVTAAATSVCLVVATACSVEPDARPRSLGGEGIEIDFGASGDTADGVDRIYLVGPGDEQLLRAVARDAQGTDDLISSLFLGPNDRELELEIFSAIPPEAEVLSTRRLSPRLLRVDTTAELRELSGEALIRALAQIVYTATAIENVVSVQITVEGEEVAWPKANGETTTEPLRIYDYPNAAQSAQPAYPAQPLDG